MRGEVTEDARLHIAAVIDVEVFSAPRNAAAGQSAVAPEIQRNDRLRQPAMPHDLPDLVALLGSRHEVHIGILADRHVKEKPAVQHPFVDQHVDPFFRTDHIDILTGHQRRESEHAAGLAQIVHCPHDGLERAFAARRVSEFGRAVDADLRRHIAKLNQLCGHLLVDEETAGVDLEKRSVVLGYDIQQVRIDERFAAENDEKVDAHVFRVRQQNRHTQHGKVWREKTSASRVLAALASSPATKALDPDPFPRHSLRHAVYAALLHFGLETAF